MSDIDGTRAALDRLHAELNVVHEQGRAIHARFNEAAAAHDSIAMQSLNEEHIDLIDVVHVLLEQYREVSARYQVLLRAQ